MQSFFRHAWMWFSVFVLAGTLVACGGGPEGGGTPGTTGNTGNTVFTGSVSVLAGQLGGAGNLDGTGAAAHFAFPFGIAIDSVGNVFVADFQSHTIRKISPAGVVTTFAGKAGEDGSTDGTGAAARFNNPTGLATDSGNNVFVTDSGNHTIRKITPAGVVTTFAGAASVADSTDGAGAAARFNCPQGLAIDSGNNVFVADTYNHTIRKITPAGVVTTLAGTTGVADSTDATGAAARFNNPTGLATDSTGNVFVADTLNHTIRKITPAGVVTTLAGTAGAWGSADATGTAARLNNPYGLATDSAGNVFVADTLNHTIRKITPTGVVTTFAGTAGMDGSTDGAGTAARFRYPNGLAVDSTGNVFVADSGNHTIRKITPAGVVTTVAGIAGVAGVVPGPLPTSLNSAYGITIDRSGVLYVTTENSVLKVVLP